MSRFVVRSSQLIRKPKPSEVEATKKGFDDAIYDPVVNPAILTVLKALEPFALTFYSEEDWSTVVAEAGRVTTLDELSLGSQRVLEKAKFASRSEAARFAASQRWKNHQKTETASEPTSSAGSSLTTSPAASAPSAEDVNEAMSKVVPGSVTAYDIQIPNKDAKAMIKRGLKRSLAGAIAFTLPMTDESGRRWYTDTQLVIKEDRIPLAQKAPYVDPQKLSEDARATNTEEQLSQRLTQLKKVMSKEGQVGIKPVARFKAVPKAGNKDSSDRVILRTDDGDYVEVLADRFAVLDGNRDITSRNVTFKFSKSSSSAKGEVRGMIVAYENGEPIGALMNYPNLSSAELAAIEQSR